MWNIGLDALRDKNADLGLALRQLHPCATSHFIEG